MPPSKSNSKKDDSGESADKEERKQTKLDSMVSKVNKDSSSSHQLILSKFKHVSIE